MGKTSFTDLGTFLMGIKENTSNYSFLEFENFAATPEGLSILTAANPSPDGNIDIAGSIKGVTGAKDPALPMTISAPDINNNKLQFTMLINPANMNHGKTSTVHAAYTRDGYITQLWGPNQDLLTATGTTAAFMVSGAGLTAVDRRLSMGMHNFFALLYAYRNNGYEFVDPASIRTAFTRVINVIHGIEITYDGQSYLGHFNNFTIDENAEKPFLFDYNFEFVVSSLSNDYNEIRGHFISIGEEPLKNTGIAARLLSNLNRRGKTLIESTLKPDESTESGYTKDDSKVDLKAVGINAEPQGTLGGAPADVTNLAPNTKAALYGMAQRYKEIYGTTIDVTSAYRTYEQQKILYDNTNKKYPVDKPGTSKHEDGEALDVDRATLNNLKKIDPSTGQTFMEEFGFWQPHEANDPIHLELNPNAPKLTKEAASNYANVMEGASYGQSTPVGVPPNYLVYRQQQTNGGRG